MTCPGVVYVALVIDAFSRRIVGWKADTTTKTSLVLDTLEMALWARDRQGLPVGAGMIHHHDNGSQIPVPCLHITAHRGGRRRVGRIGRRRLRHAMAETMIGLIKTEKINRGAPWKTMADVELAIAVSPGLTGSDPRGRVPRLRRFEPRSSRSSPDHRTREVRRPMRFSTQVVRCKADRSLGQGLRVAVTRVCPRHR